MFKGYLQQMALPRGCEPEIESEHPFTSQRKKTQNPSNPSRFRLVRTMLMMFCKRCNSCKGSSLVEGKAERRFITATSQFGVKHQGCWSKSMFDRNSVTLQLYWEIVRIKAGTHPKNWSSGSDIQWHSTSKSNSWAPLILTHINTEHFPNSSHRLEQEDVQRSPEALRRRVLAPHFTSFTPWVAQLRRFSIFPSALSMTTPLSLGPANFWICARKISSTKSGGLGDTWTRPIIGWPITAETKWGDLYGYHQE